MKKEICFIMPSMSGGGAERVVSVLCNYFVEKDYKVSISLIDKDQIDYKLNEKIYVDKSLLSNKKGIKRKIHRFNGIRKLLKSKPDAVFISFLSMYNLYTLAAATGMKRQIIVSERLDPRKSLQNRKWLFGVRNRLYAKADRVVFQTIEAKAFFPEAVKKKGVIIANPLKEGLPTRYAGVRRKEVVTFARLEPQKNYPLLIEAFEKFKDVYPEYTLAIFGKGSMEEKLKEIVKEKNMNSSVKFYGFCNTLHAQIKDAAMFVLPSDYEGLSNSMLEAMAIGLPVICTDCPPGGARMFIKDGENGLLVPVKDADAMLNAMCRIAENPEFADKLSANAEKVKEELHVDSICEQWEQIIN